MSGSGSSGWNPWGELAAREWGVGSGEWGVGAVAKEPGSVDGVKADLSGQESIDQRVGRGIVA